MDAQCGTTASLYDTARFIHSFDTTPTKESYHQQRNDEHCFKLRCSSSSSSCCETVVGVCWYREEWPLENHHVAAATTANEISHCGGWRFWSGRHWVAQCSRSYVWYCEYTCVSVLVGF